MNGKVARRLRKEAKKQAGAFQYRMLMQKETKQLVNNPASERSIYLKLKRAYKKS